MISDNHFLGNFLLDGIPRLPRGVPKLNVTFAIDSDGILTVTAVDKTPGSTGNTASIKITSEMSSLDSDEIERMIRDAERFAEEDKIIKQNVLAKNNLEQLAYLARSRIENEGDVSKSNRDKIGEAATNTLDWIKMHPAEDKLVYEERLLNLKNLVIPIAGNIFRDEL